MIRRLFLKWFCISLINCYYFFIFLKILFTKLPELVSKRTPFRNAPLSISILSRMRYATSHYYSLRFGVRCSNTLQSGSNFEMRTELCRENSACALARQILGICNVFTYCLHKY